MLEIHLICVGKLKEKYYSDACAEYQKRLGAYCRLKITELPEAKRPSSPSPAETAAAMAKEADGVRAAMAKGETLIVMTPEGEMLSSEKLSAALEGFALKGASKLCFLIGGSDGIDPSLKKEAAAKISMSPMTFPHHLARVMLLEQIYRALSISAGSKYHK